MSTRTLILFLPLLAWGQSFDPPAHQKLIPTLWVQTSVEWQAVCRETYLLARIRLDESLKDKTLTASLEQSKLPPKQYRKLPPAVIVDIDETVLDNSADAARQVKESRDYTEEAWAKWVLEAKAAPIPGAVEFLKYAASRGVTVFYVTNRIAAHEAATRKNLLARGFPVREDMDTVLTRGEKPGWEVSEKASRWALIAEKFRVVMKAGDDLGDFIAGARVSAAQRIELTAPYREWFGKLWIVLPNPNYGSWEEAVTGPPRPPEGSVRLEKKLGALRTTGE